MLHHVYGHTKFYFQILPALPGQKINDFFDLVRPIIEFAFDVVLQRSNNIFEIMTNEPIDALLKAGGKEISTSQRSNDDDMNLMEEDVDNSLHLKGQMMYMGEWNVIMYLCSPSISDIDQLNFAGLYINDLPMHDFSRDIILAGKSKFLWK